MMPQRARLRAVRRAGAARQPAALDHPVPRPPRAEPECRHCGAENGQGRRAHGLREGEGRAVVRDERYGAPDDLRRLPEREPATAVDRRPPPATAPPPDRPHDPIAQARVLGPSDHHEPRARGEPLRQLPVVRPPFRAPDGARRERDERLAPPPPPPPPPARPPPTRPRP